MRASSLLLLPALSSPEHEHQAGDQLQSEPIRISVCAVRRYQARFDSIAAMTM
jgi:hypothetical protein